MPALATTTNTPIASSPARLHGASDTAAKLQQIVCDRLAPHTQQSHTDCPCRLQLKPTRMGEMYVCMLFISTVDQPIERVTIQALDCLLAVAPAQAGRAWGGGDYVVA